jgi:hypothetical protein
VLPPAVLVAPLELASDEGGAPPAPLSTGGFPASDESKQPPLRQTSPGAQSASLEQPAPHVFPSTPHPNG